MNSSVALPNVRSRHRKLLGSTRGPHLSRVPAAGWLRDSWPLTLEGVTFVEGDRDHPALRKRIGACNLFALRQETALLVSEFCRIRRPQQASVVGRRLAPSLREFSPDRALAVGRRGCWPTRFDWYVICCSGGDRSHEFGRSEWLKYSNPTELKA